MIHHGNSHAIFGSIQEDRHKVEQFHFLWNGSTICGTASQKMRNSSQKVEQVLKAGLWNSSIICGTAPPKVACYGTVCHF